jgi:hypothetical protein
MSQPTYGTGTALPVSPSRILLVWVVLAGATALILCALYLPLWGTLAVGALVIFAAADAARRDALLMAPESIIELRLSHSRLDCRFKNGQWQEGLTTIPGSSFVNRWVSIVVFRKSGATRIRRIILMPDSLSSDGFRHLRTWLQWSKSTEPTETGS